MRPATRAVGLAQILVVERDPLLGAQLVEQLAADGFPAKLARSAEHARALARAAPPQLLILGALETPRAALELLLEVRAAGLSRADPVESPWVAGLPAIVLGEAAHEADLLRAFEAGADDFLVRGASYLVLRARLRALLARLVSAPDSTLVRVGALAIDTSAHAATLRGRRLALRRLEYELLLTLARDPERVFSRAELMRLVWGQCGSSSSRTLDSHASRLRRSLGAAGPERWVLNVRGVGYRLT